MRWPSRSILLVFKRICLPILNETKVKTIKLVHPIIPCNLIKVRIWAGFETNGCSIRANASKLQFQWDSIFLSLRRWRLLKLKGKLKSEKSFERDKNYISFQLVEGSIAGRGKINFSPLFVPDSITWVNCWKARKCCQPKYTSEIY